MQLACATIPGVHAIAQSPVVDVKGENDDNNGGDFSASLQFLGSQQLVCFVKQLDVGHVPSPRLHGNHCPCLKIVASDGCCAPMLSNAHGTRSWGGGNYATYPMCEEFYGSTSEEFAAMKIPSRKLVCVNQIVLATCAKTWVVGHVLENYTCLSYGKDLYNADFGDSYGHQTVLVGECKSLCNIE